MTESFLNKLKQLSPVRNKLFLCTGSNERLINEFIEKLQSRFSIQVSDIGKLLSVYLSCFDFEKMKPGIVEEFLLNELNNKKYYIKYADSDIIVMCNIGFLFEKLLNLDILQILKSLSRNTIVCLVSKGLFIPGENIFHFYNSNSEYKINFADNYVAYFDINDYEI